MPAPTIYFDPPYDIHPLRGQVLQIVNAANPFASLLSIGSEFANVQNRIPNFYLDSEGIHNYTRIEEVWIMPTRLTITPGVRHQVRLCIRFYDAVVAQIGNQRNGNNFIDEQEVPRSGKLITRTYQ
ncbi:hypothetical protein [Spirosoma sp. KNUC1025]|uniref:hypothetical protein n=1 Tax=Spirosoma sp. KNUC1025 TaxID=2894082 RepID=UPI003863A20A|nr:hypothetical protein LN737_28065 [Spirosoma sp. KNUC1025]